MHGIIVNIVSLYYTCRHSSLAVSRYAKQTMPIYDAIVKAFVDDNSHGLMDIINQHYDELSHDLNLGIANQVHSSLFKRRFLKLSKIYLSLSLDQVNDKVGIADQSEVIIHLMNLSRNGQVTVTIDDITKNVRFIDTSIINDNIDDESKASEVDLSSNTLRQLQDGLQTTMQLSDKLRELRKHVLTSSKYIAKTASSSSSKTVGYPKDSSMNIGGGYSSSVMYY